MSDKSYFVYIMTNKRNGTIYTGVTNNLSRRIEAHRAKQVSGFTAKYGIDMLVYYEQHLEIMSAIKREKQIKRWRRKWKLQLIEEFNHDWKDLSLEL